MGEPVPAAPFLQPNHCTMSLHFNITFRVHCMHPHLTHCAMSLQILGALHAVHAVAVFFKLMSPALYSPGAGRRGMYTLVILNSLNLAVACRYACLQGASHVAPLQSHTLLINTWTVTAFESAMQPLQLA